MVPRGTHWPPELQLGTKVPTEPAAALKAWPSLRHAQAPVRAFCAQRGIPYAETGLLASYAQVLRHLHTTGRAAGPEPAADTAARLDVTPEPGSRRRLFAARA